jgi:hypothetical protein
VEYNDADWLWMDAYHRNILHDIHDTSAALRGMCSLLDYLFLNLTVAVYDGANIFGYGDE